jgi:glucan phosphoethanolaminetransferase (alkaline phosphatase superfamily)
MQAKKNHFTFYVARGFVVVILLLIYIFGLRPLRRIITQQLVLPAVNAHVRKHPFPYKITNKGTAVTFTSRRNHETRILRYQPQLGLFFLAALIVLVFIATRSKWYLYLIIFHVLLMFMMFGILYLSLKDWYAGFSIIDFLVRYLIPGLTFGYAAFVYHREFQLLSDAIIGNKRPLKSNF